jgi:hypothetical protein
LVGEQVVQYKSFPLSRTETCSSPFLERTAGARRPETVRRRQGWDNPGRPGNGWWQLVPPSPPEPQPRFLAGRSHQFLWPESCPVSSHTNQELSGKARLETASEPSQAHGPFRSVRLRSYPEGFGCYCADQNAVALSGGPTPPKGPVRSPGSGA